MRGTTKYVTRHGKRIAIKDTGMSPPKRKPFKAKFVQIPTRWLKALRRSKSVSTYRLALEILLRKFESNYDSEITLSSAVTGMAHTTRVRAAKELAEFGLIKLRQEGKAAYRVKI